MVSNTMLKGTSVYEFEREQSRWPASTDMDTLMEMRSTLIENERLDSRTFDQTVSAVLFRWVHAT